MLQVPSFLVFNLQIDWPEFHEVSSRVLLIHHAFPAVHFRFDGFRPILHMILLMGLSDFVSGVLGAQSLRI